MVGRPRQLDKRAVDANKDQKKLISRGETNAAGRALARKEKSSGGVD